MNKRDAGLQVWRNRLFLIFCFFCIKTKEKHTVFEPFNLRIYFENFNNESSIKVKLLPRFLQPDYLRKEVSNNWFGRKKGVFIILFLR